MLSKIFFTFYRYHNQLCIILSIVNNTDRICQKINTENFTVIVRKLLGIQFFFLVRKIDRIIDFAVNGGGRMVNEYILKWNVKNGYEGEMKRKDRIKDDDNNNNNNNNK